MQHLLCSCVDIDINALRCIPLRQFAHGPISHLVLLVCGSDHAAYWSYINMSQSPACSVVSPLAVRQRLARHFRKIKSPQMQLIYNYPKEEYWLTTDSGAQYGPITWCDLLPLARYFGAYRPADRCKEYALQLPDGSILPEGKLRNALHIQFTSQALARTQEELAKGGTVQQEPEYPEPPEGFDAPGGDHANI